MKYILVDFGGQTGRKLLRIADERSYGRLLAYYKWKFRAWEVSSPPKSRTIREWKQRGRARAICGCWISSASGERCPTHSCMSWLSAAIGLRL